MKIRSLLLSLAFCLTATMAKAIVTADGFPIPDPSVNNGTQLSGLGATGPYGSYDSPYVGFAAWEKWSSGSFINLTPQYTGASGLLNVTLTQSNDGAGVSTSGSNPGIIDVDGVTYHGRLTTGGYDFNLSGTSAVAFTSLTLQIKHSPFFDADFNPITAFTASLNGMASAPVQVGPNLGNFSDAIGLNTSNSVYTYSWSNLNIAENEAFSLQFASGADLTGFGFSVDSIAINVQAIPEPGTWALIALAGLFVLVFRRNRNLSSLKI